MRKTKSRMRSLAAAGTAAGAATLAALVAPQAAHAVAFATSSPLAGPPATVVTVTSAGLWTSTTGVLLIATTTPGVSTCPSTYTTTGTVVPTFTKTSASSLSITIPATLPLETNNAAKQYSVCTYLTATSGAAAVNDGFFTATPASTVAPTSGPSGGGTNVTVTFATTTTVPSTVGSIFVPKATDCPAVYSTTNAAVNGTAAKATDNTVTVSVPPGAAGSGSAATPYNICLYDGTTDATSKIFSTLGSGAYNVQLPVATTSPSVGAGGGGSPAPTIVVSSATNFLTGITAGQALFKTVASGACPATYVATATFFSPVLKSGNNRAAVRLPSGVVAGGVTTPYNVCIYSSDVVYPTAGYGRLLVNSTYSAAVAPTVASVSPAAGSSLGGDVITVTGTGFPTTGTSLKATLGGIPLAGITLVDPFTFTAVTPLRAAEKGVALVVTTDNGSVTKTAAFDYLNAISVMPNTSPNTADGLWVNVKGVGFESLNFDTTNGYAASDPEARIWLIDANGGACTSLGPPQVCPSTGYDPEAAGTFTATGGPSAECLTPAVVSGNELFCKLNLKTGGLVTTTGLPAAAGLAAIVKNGTYNLIVVSNGGVTTGYTETLISGGSTFTVSDF
ncbi:MAG TPA: IPT/TIG domain-containing protein [Actinoplanes sp.]|nr:IPT/TIG domain-containing protein [Actinoplanes sp.]